MRILSAYIEAFGGLNKASYTFDAGLSEILADNGTGKSTLAAFIKAMLYGLSGSRNTKDFESNEFRLYQPWGGGRFGGTLTIACAKGRFRIERYFDSQSKELGELSVIDTETEQASDALGENPGYALFGVDGESFLMTAYLSSRGRTAGKTTDITAKLGGLEGEIFDMSAYQKAQDMLEKKRKEIKNVKGGKNDKLLDLAERERRRLEDELTEAQGAAAKANELRPALAALRAEARTTADALDLALTAQREREKQRGAADARREQCARLEKEIAEAEREREALLTTLPPERPTEAQLDRLATDVAEGERLERRVAAHEAPPHLPDEAALTELEARIDEVTRTADVLAATPCPAALTKESGHMVRLLAVLCAALVVSGIVALIFLPLLGGILLAVAAALALLAVLTLRRARAAAAELTRGEEVYRLAVKAHAEASDALAAAFAREGIAPTDRVGIAALRARLSDWRVLDAAQRREAQELLEHRTSLSERLAQYGITEGVGVIRSLRERLRRLDELEDALSKKRAEHTSIAQTATAEPPADAISDAELDALITEGRERERRIASDITATERLISDYTRIADQQDAISDALAAAKDTCERLAHRIAVLDAARDYLAKARATIERRCFGGLRARLDGYNARFLEPRGMTLRLDSELALSISEGGEGGVGRDIAFFSTGLRAIADICLRLALTDELFGEEPPPLVLDDPFMALDGANLAKARELLILLARERQILYLTCHPSRTLA